MSVCVCVSVFAHVCVYFPYAHGCACVLIDNSTDSLADGKICFLANNTFDFFFLTLLDCELMSSASYERLAD